VRLDGNDDVLVSCDFEIKPPASGDPSLPEIGFHVVFLRVQRRVLQVGKKKVELFRERLAASAERPA
jgi:hypothetical protein